jgi:hypothetical protein
MRAVKTLQRQHISNNNNNNNNNNVCGYLFDEAISGADVINPRHGS